MDSLGQYVPVFKVVATQAMEKFIEDGVFHVELRGLPTLYSENGTELTQAEAITLLRQLLAGIQQNLPPTHSPICTNMS